MTLFRFLALALPVAGLFTALPSCSPPAEAIAAGTAIAAPAGEGATIKVYRSFSSPAGTAARIYLDDAFLGYVSARSQNTFHVKPGTYRIAVKFPPGLLIMPHRSKPFTVSKGETAHFGIGFSGGGEFIAGNGVRKLGTDEAVRINERYPSRGD